MCSIPLSHLQFRFISIRFHSREVGKSIKSLILIHKQEKHKHARHCSPNHSPVSTRQFPKNFMCTSYDTLQSIYVYVLCVDIFFSVNYVCLGLRNFFITDELYKGSCLVVDCCCCCCCRYRFCYFRCLTCISLMYAYKSKYLSMIFFFFVFYLHYNFSALVRCSFL